MATLHSLATHLFAGLVACSLASLGAPSGAQDLADLLATEVNEEGTDVDATATEGEVELATDQTTSDQTTSDQTTSDQATSDQAVPEQTPGASQAIDIAAYLAEGEGEFGEMSEEVPAAQSVPSIETESANEASVDAAKDKADSKDSNATVSKKDADSKKSASTELSIDRPISLLTIDPATRGELSERMVKLKPAYQIQSPALQTFGDWWAPLFDVAFQPARYSPQGFCWAAPSVYHRPLHFEEPNLERYGHYVAVVEGRHCLQSAVSAAHFFGSIPLMPYKLGADPCWERHYVLGCYRPGSCNPHRLVRPELSARGLLYQGLFTTGAVFVTP